MDISEAYPDDTSTLLGSITTGLEKDCAVMEDKSTDFPKPFPGLSIPSSLRRGPTERKSDEIEEISTSRQLALDRNKHGKICRWWRNGRCHQGDKCRFAHYYRVSDAVKGWTRTELEKGSICGALSPIQEVGSGSKPILEQRRATFGVCIRTREESIPYG